MRCPSDQDTYSLDYVGANSLYAINLFLAFFDFFGYLLLFILLVLLVDKAIYPLFDNGKYAVSKGSFFKLLFLYSPSSSESDEELPLVRERDQFAKEVFIGENVAYNPDDGLGSGVASLLKNQSSLESVSVSEKNQYLCAVDGNLFTKDGKTLVRRPPGRGDAGYDVPEGVETIAAGAFARSSLTSIAIPKSVEVIDDFAFIDCSSLTSIDVDPNNLKYRSIDGVLFTKDGKTLVKFPEAKKDESYVVPEGTVTIKDAAFLNCSGLTSIVIPKGMLSIGVGAFQNCAALNSIVIPGSVKSIESNAFVGCSSLNSVVIPKSVTSIGVGAFKLCSSLSEIVIPGSVTSIESSAFAECSSLSSVVVCEGVTSIEDSAFSSCPSLKNVILPSSVTSIGDSAFDKRCTFECDFPKGSYAEEFVKTHAKKFGRKYGIKRAKKKRLK